MTASAPAGRRSAANVRRFGIVAAIVALVLDQGSKLWLLNVFDLPARQPVHLAPVLDLIMTWNRGVSYSLLWSDGEAGRWLLIAGTLFAAGLLAYWLANARSMLTGVALGLLIGGALGNVIDRVAYGAVADFIFFHVGSFRWYVFNGADCAISVGVGLLLIDLLRPGSGESVHKLP